MKICLISMSSGYVCLCVCLSVKSNHIICSISFCLSFCLFLLILSLYIISGFELLGFGSFSSSTIPFLFEQTCSLPWLPPLLFLTFRSH